MSPWLHIIGFGEGELPTLPPAATVLGPERAISRLSAAPRAEGDRHETRSGRPRLQSWRSPRLEAMLAQTLEHRGTPTVLLASGDPLWFGFGATLARHLSSDEFSVTPAASSFQLAAARLRWPLQHVTTL